MLTAGEACDDGNLVSGDGCDSNCTTTVCGNGVVTAGEECDDANAINTDACIVDCVNAFCGDGFLRASSAEQCDSGAQNSDTTADRCRTNCLPARCGDGVIDSGEACDDGDSQSGDGCSSTCVVEAGVCGNGVVESPEECDDTNTVSRDGCSAVCTNEIDEVEPNNTPLSQSNPFLASYGGRISPNNDQDCMQVPATAQDLVIMRMEDFGTLGCDQNQFDPTITFFNTNGTTQLGFNDDYAGLCSFLQVIVPTTGTYFACAESYANASSFVYEMQTTVAPSGCGDGNADPVEQCDDGDTQSGDGCSNVCRVETGYTCTGSPSVCTRPCGNGTVNAGETCDDANTAAGDGCSALCATEPGYACTGTPSVCSFVCGNGTLNAGEVCDDGDATSGDGCSNVCTVEAGYTCSGTPSLCNGICGDLLIRGTEQCDDGNLTPGDFCNPVCRNEVSESEANNTDGTADGPISASDGFHGNVGSGDVDVIRAVTSATGTLTIIVSGGQTCNGQRGLLLTLANSGGGTIASNQSTSCPSLTVTNQPAGTYYIRIAATGAQGNSYSAAIYLP